MKQSGQTLEGQLVMADVFNLVGTHGTPLEIILNYMKDRDMVVDWIDYIASAQKDGHNSSTIKSRIMAAVGDVYGSDYAKQFAIRLDKIG